MGNDQYDVELHQQKGEELDAVQQNMMEKSPTTDEDTIGQQTRIQRLFSFGQIFAFSLTFMSSWEAVVNNLYLALDNGGPPTLIWSLVVAYIGALAQSASIAELSSISPISGAQYHWTYQLAHPKWRRLITWIQGWVTWFGWVSLLAGVADVTTNLLLAIISLTHPSFDATRWQVVLLVILMVIIGGLVNQYAFWIIPRLEVVSGILHVVVFIVYVAVIVAMGSRHTAEFVFVEHQAITSGWNNQFISWNVGMITATWAFTGFDGAVHMSEEVRKSKQAVPRAVFWSIALNGVLAIAMVLAILFCMGPLEEVLNSSYPLSAILQQVTGSTAATAVLLSAIFIISFTVMIASVASASRLTWAWARDGSLPAYFTYVDPYRRVPVRSVWLPVFLVIILSLLNIASSSAFGAIIALSSIALFMSYFIAICCILTARFRKSHPLILGNWNLGRYGLFINIFALIYTAWIIVFLPFPEFIPVTGETMNYAGPIVIAVILFALGYWFLRAKRSWPGPNVAIIKHVLESE